MGNKRWWIIGGLMLLIGLGVSLKIVGSRPGPQPQSVAAPDMQSGPHPKVKGPDSAPVKVVEFGDFQ